MFAIYLQDVRAPWTLFQLGNQRVLYVRNRSTDGAIIQGAVVVGLAAESGNFT